MRELAAQRTLGGSAGEELTVQVAPGLRLRETALSSLSIRVPRTQNADDIGARLGVTLPASPNNALELDGGWIVCTEPNAWRVLAAQDTHRKLSAALADVSTAFALVTDLGSAYCIIEVRGAGARRAIASGCPLDLHARAFKTGSTASSQLVDIPVLIVKTSDEPGFLVSCERSHAHILWDRLADAAAVS